MPKRDDALLAELAEIYTQADALHASWVCPASTECCRFGITGVEPYVTSIELLAVQVAIARRGGALRVDRRAAPLTADPSTERICPLLDRDGRCWVYSWRPFGCRTYFCSRASKGQRVEHRVLLELVRRLQDLAVRHVPDGDRPHRFGSLVGPRSR